MFTMTAFAAPNIDEDATGSITIHKYVNESLNFPGSTGGEVEIPDGAHALAGVEFTIYQIVNKADLLKYYSGEAESITIPTKEQLTGSAANNAGNVCIKDPTTGKWRLNPDGPYASIGGTAKTTDENGVAAFTGLDLGIYLVIETNSPDVVTTPADPFLVSVPMTLKAQNDTQTDTWIYDVHVYPKNSTASSSEVKICKVGKTLGSDELVPLPGVKFQVQKHDVTDGTWTPVTETTNQYGEKTPLGETITVNGTEYHGVLTSGDDGIVGVTNLAPGEYRFVEISTVGGYILRDKRAWYFRILADGTLEWSRDISTNDSIYNSVYEIRKDGTQSGYLFKEDGVLGKTPQNSALPILGGVPYAVNYKPDIEKEVLPKGKPVPTLGDDSSYDDSAYEKEANYSVGDVIPYELTVQIPVLNDGALGVFTISDNPSNLKVDIDSFKFIGMDSEHPENGAWDIDMTYQDGYSVVENGNGFTMTLPTQYFTNKLIIKYNATLLDSAVATSKDGNPNEVTLEYSNSYNGSGTNKITDRAVVYSGEIDVHKHDGSNKALANVEFELYEQQAATVAPGDSVGEGDKAKTTLTAEEATAKGLKDPDTTAYLQIGGTYKTDADGNISVKGLSDGTYWLVETKTAIGYNLLKEPVEVVLNLQHQTTFDATETWTMKEDGSGYVFVKNAFTGRTFNQTVNGGTNVGILKDVINRSGFQLPTTGGMGTFLFTFVGIAMMAAAVILFFTSKKKETK